MGDLGRILVVVLGLLLFVAYGAWAVNDAKRRGKSRLLVLIGVIFFFPIGLVAWLIFRPAVAGSSVAVPHQPGPSPSR